MEHGAENLSALEDHFDHVPVRVVAGAAVDIQIQHEDVHDRGPVRFPFFEDAHWIF